MNRDPAMMPNSTYIEEVELDEDEANLDDVTPLVSGDTPMISVPTSEDEKAAVDLGEDGDEDEDIQDYLERT